jgi:acetyl-CoA acetyltransferase
MSDVYVLASAATPFRRLPDWDFRGLADAVIRDVLVDAELEDGRDLEAAWFANCGLVHWGQDTIGGQVVLSESLRTGTLPAGMPVVDVEAAGASGGAALHAASQAVAAGSADLVLVLGVEKAWLPADPQRTFQLFASGIDQRHPAAWKAFLAQQGDRHGVGWAPDPRRLVSVDIDAMQARHHMRQFGTTAEQIAAIAAKNHDNGHHSPRARGRQDLTVDAVLAERLIVDPLTRLMCAPVSDGAAAALLCSASFLRSRTRAVRERAIRIRAVAMAGGTWRGLGEADVVRAAAQRAWQRSGLTPAHVDIAEIQDETAFGELRAMESLGLCETGGGGPYVESGATHHAGERPVNLSGGLLSLGNPLGATGLGMLDELVHQLRGEAYGRQAPRDPQVGLLQNSGGHVALDEALCCVALLERTA